MCKLHNKKTENGRKMKSECRIKLQIDTKYSFFSGFGSGITQFYTCKNANYIVSL